MEQQLVNDTGGVEIIDPKSDEQKDTLNHYAEKYWKTEEEAVLLI
jgi:hypothetical protein